MKLNLERPLIIFDLETTGLNIFRDRIIEISYIKLFPDGSSLTEKRRVNPGINIPQDSVQVHHITNEDVVDCPSFREIADELIELFEDCDLSGYNCMKFDIPMLMEEFCRVGRNFSLIGRNIVDVQNIFYKKEPRTLSAAYQFYCGKEHPGEHDSLEDTKVTLEVLEAQLDKYEDIENNIESLAEVSAFSKNMDLAGRFVKNDRGEAVVNFGKHKGRLLKEVFQREPSFYNWIMQGEFAKDTKDLVAVLHKRYHSKR